MLKILQINKFYYLKGGSERYFFDLSRLLEKNGHKIIPFSMKDGRNEFSPYQQYFIDKVDFKISPGNMAKVFYNFEAVRRLEKLVQSEKPDIAHLHNIAHQISPAIIGLLNRYNIPIVQTLHDYKLICPNYKLFAHGVICDKCVNQDYYNCIRERCVNNSWLKSAMLAAEAYWNHKILKEYDDVNLFLAPSSYLRDQCIKFGVPEERIKMMNYFLPEEFMDGGENIRTGGGSNYLLCFGRLSPEKGIQVLLEAVKKVGLKIKLKIVGEGPDFRELEASIKMKKLESNVLLTGAEYGQELRSIIERARAIIIPSIWPENMPYSLIESLALGKVVIASKIGGIPEFIEDGSNGFLFSPGNSNELAEKIKDLEKFNPDDVGKKAKESVLRFNEKNHYGEIMRIYTGLIKGHKGHKGHKG